MNYNLIKKIHVELQSHNLIPDNASIILGLSGGPDSVFLLYVLKKLQKKLNLTIIAAHLDHQWRDESNQDVLFCKQLTESLQIPFVAKTIKDLKTSITYNGSQEELGRKYRRFFFEDLKKKYNADIIALAHHADDQHETFFIRLLRGASLSGLTGMKIKNGDYIRPLLHVSKNEILTYLDNNSIAYLTDPTNTSTNFLRNRIRNTLIPAFESCDPRFSKTLQATMNRLTRAEDFLEDFTVKTFEKMNVSHEDTASLNITEFNALHPEIQYRILVHWLCLHRVPFTPTQSFFDELRRFLAQPGNKTHYMHTHWFIKKYNGYATIITEQ